jgi:hypothetical protein
MELNPFVSTGAFIKERDPMISNGNLKKDANNFFNILKKPGSVSMNLLVYIIFFLFNTNCTKDNPQLISSRNQGVALRATNRCQSIQIFVYLSLIFSAIQFLEHNSFKYPLIFIFPNERNRIE